VTRAEAVHHSAGLHSIKRVRLIVPAHAPGSTGSQMEQVPVAATGRHEWDGSLDGFAIAYAVDPYDSPPASRPTWTLRVVGADPGAMDISVTTGRVSALALLWRPLRNHIDPCTIRIARYDPWRVDGGGECG
jgi:hypothetical protein